MSLKILLADDSVTAQNMGKKILSDAGYEVLAVSNGSAALKKIPEIKPDLVILDIYMPGYSGLEVCQKIKEARQTASLPVLLTVGKLEPFKARDASRVRADGFIVKPFEATELLSTIKRIVGAVAESPRGKGKNGEESRSRVKEASQTASAEQLESPMRNVLPEAYGEQQQPGEAPAFPVNQNPDAGEEQRENPYATEEGTAKFRVDLHKKSRPREAADEDVRFTASSFETWEKSRGEPDRESREDALRRIRAAREAEASGQENAGPETEPGPDEAAVAEPASPVAEHRVEAPEAAEVAAENYQTAAVIQPGYREQASAEQQQISREGQAPEIPAGNAEAVPAEGVSSSERANKPHTPISGLADWAADLREDTVGAPQTSSVEVISKWIAEEVPLGTGDAGVSLSEEMQRFQAGPGEAKAEEPARVEESAGAAQYESKEPEPPEAYAEAEEPAPVEAEAERSSAEAQAEPAAVEAEPAGQPENTEAVAALAKAAAAAAMSSISEIREAVLASAAAAGVSSSATVESRAVEQPAEAAHSVDMSQFAAQPPGSPVEDVQGATIAAVTKEVTESAPADLNSDAIASIVNRVIEQMKPKLVAEIAKELTHKPKDE